MNTCQYCHSPYSGNSQFCCSSCELLSSWLSQGHSPLEIKKNGSQKWEKFNLFELESVYNSSSCPIFKKFKFYLDGLQCSSCVHLLEDLPQYANGIDWARVDYSRNTIEIQAQSHINLGTICSWISDLGYQPTPIKGNLDFEKAKQIDNRQDLKRIGVAGAVAGNLMLFSVPIYAGLIGELSLVFKWLSFFLFLPLLFFSATPFFKRAWASLLVRRINVDMMIVVALLAGFGFSTSALVLGLDEIYFDSTASFIFLILVTRYVLKKYQDRVLHKNIMDDLFGSEIYVTQNGNNTKLVRFDQLEAGWRVKIKDSQVIPCDATLQSEQQTFDLSFLTGEAYPQLKHCGDRIMAGSRLLQGSAWIQCLQSSQNSELAKSLLQMDSLKTTKSDIQNLSDLYSHRLTLAVFAVAGLFFILTYPVLGIEAFKRCLALITIACPCAIAFGAPLAHTLGMKKALKQGFFIRSGGVFEKLSSIRKVVFDKTGTLTSSDLSLIQTFPPALSSDYKSIILGLEKKSLHPVANSLRKVWNESNVIALNDVTEKAGDGVWASIDGHVYRVSRPAVVPDNEMLQVDFSCDGRPIAYLYFSERVVPEAANVVRSFHNHGVDVMMLTGDSRGRAISIAKNLGIRPAYVFSSQSPTSKKEMIQKNNPCLYIGDGLNDLMALQEAFVSFAVRGPFEATMQVSDVYAPQKKLTALLELVELSKRVHTTLKTNLFFAIFYNTVGGILALLGFVNPLVAAILMPLSSLAITSHTVTRLR
jgi:P-type Cu+ transporter